MSVINAAVLKDPPEISCLRCGFTGKPDAWDSTRRHEEQGYGYGNVFTCPDCDCQWDTSSVSECESCGVSNTAEELEYIGEGLHVEALCKSCENVVGHGNRVTRYSQESEN